MTTQNNFSVRVLRNDGQPLPETDSGHVLIPDGAQYQISLRNYHSRDAAAEVWIDGRSMGLYVVKAKSKLIVDSPMNNDEGRFTFFKTDSEIGRGIQESDQTAMDLGLVQVTFTLFKAQPKETDVEKWLKEIKNAIASKPFGGNTVIIEREVYPWRYHKPYWWDQPVITYLGGSPFSPAYTVPLNGCTVQGSFTGGGGTSGGGGSVVTNMVHTVADSKSPMPTFTTACSANFSSGDEDMPKFDASKFGKAEAGITGLTGVSDKVYEEVSDTSLFDLDTEHTIELRLVVSDNTPKLAVRKLPGNRSRTPAPV